MSAMTALASKSSLIPGGGGGTPRVVAIGGVNVENPSLLVEAAKSQATQEVLRVVDKSLESAAKAREEREHAEAERRREEQARQRVEHAEKTERRDAERLRDRVERQADEIGQRAAEREAQNEERSIPLYQAPGSRLDLAA
jgi:hypothetical protein